MPIAPTQPVLQKSFMQKRIPTLIGLGFLVIGLVVGVVFLGKGAGIFAPRAAPETTPKQVKITNLTETTFSVSFFTDESTVGSLAIGTSEEDLTITAPDDRNAVSAGDDTFTLHHITARGLSAGTKYYFYIKTGSGAMYDNNGSPFVITTAKKTGTPTAAKTIFGNVSTATGAPAGNAVAYITPEGAAELSVRVSETGSFALPLSNARTPDGSAYATITDQTPLRVFVQNELPNESITHVTRVSDSQPVTKLTFVSGQSTEVAAVDGTEMATLPEQDVIESSTEVATATAEARTSARLAADTGADATATASTTASSSASNASSSSALATETSTQSSSLADTAAGTTTVVSLENATSQTVTTNQPTIVGKAAANVQVKIEVHSDTQISDTLTADANGEFEIDISEYKQTLEPGEHTVNYSYVDPATGKTITKSKTFTVSSRTLAQATTTTTTTTPYGTTNPYRIGGTATQSAATGSATSTSSAVATSSGRKTMPSTSSGIPVSGAVGTTLALIFGGAFFIISGLWSFWVSKAFAGETTE